MECVIHHEREAVDACRGCGRPICDTCGDSSGGRFFCASCDTSAELSAPAPPVTPAVTPRQPALAALLSFLPGLGQAYNGDYLKGLTILAVLFLLVRATLVHPTLAIFAGFLWFYQIFEAFYAAASGDRQGSAVGAADGGRGGAFTAPILIVAGLVFLVENLTGVLRPRMTILLPSLVITLGIGLLLSYFRTGGEQAR